MELNEAIMMRRSVRKYRPEPVPESAVEAIIEAARFAPSWANLQVARFIIVRDPRTRKSIQSAVPEMNPAYKALGQAPLILVFAGIRELSGYYQGAQSNRHGDYAMFDVALAVENALLAACGQGLATCLIGVFDVDRVKEILALPPELDPFVMSPLGYPEKKDFKVPPRKDISQLLTWK